MSKSTPGPWLSQGFCYEGEERGTCFIVAENLGGLVGAALPWPTELDEGNFPRVEANARLIAAAPAMLAALKAFNLKEDWIVSGSADSLTLRIPITVIQQAAAAVAKAEAQP